MHALNIAQMGVVTLGWQRVERRIAVRKASDDAPVGFAG